MFHMPSLTTCSSLEYIIKRQMKSTLQMHLVVGIQPVLIVDVLFESRAILKGRNALYIKDSIARDFWKERMYPNKYHLYLQYVCIKCMHFISFSSRLSCLLHIDCICLSSIVILLAYFSNTSSLHGVTRSQLAQFEWTFQCLKKEVKIL